MPVAFFIYIFNTKARRRKEGIYALKADGDLMVADGDLMVA